MGCQKEIAETVIERGADYILPLKGNHSEMLDRVSGSFSYIKSLFNNKCYWQGGQSSRRFSLAMRELWGPITTEEQAERCRRMAVGEYYV